MSIKLNTTFSYYALFIFLGILMASTGPLLPSLAKQTGAQISEISILFSAASLGRLLGALLGGRLFDKFSGHRVIIGALVITALVASAIPFARILFILIVLYLLFGLLESMIDVGTNTLVIWLHRDKVGPFMNALHLSFGLGAFLAPIFIAQIIVRTNGISWAFWIMALLAVPLIIWVLRLPSPKAISDETQTQERITDTPLVIMLALFFGFYVSAEAGFAGWIYTYALESGLELETGAAYLTSAFFAAFTLGRLIAIPLATKVKPKTMLLIDMIGAVISLAIMLAFPQSRIIIWSASLALGLSLASAFPTALAFAERRMSVTGKITSYFFIGGSVGGIISPWIIGQLFDKIGPIAILLIMVIVAVAALLTLLVIMHYTRGKVKV